MDQNKLSLQGPLCPVPINDHQQIVIGHGAGGNLTHDLIRTVFQKHLGNAILNLGNDAALLLMHSEVPQGMQLVVSTDAHIVSPLFFAGGDIGRLSICGTVNDVSMLGAIPKYLTATFILEEGFLISDLEKILTSMAQACLEADVRIIAADTKVTEKGKSDGIFISTTGFGWVSHQCQISGRNAKPNDVVIVSGPLGNHGIAVAEARGNLGFQSQIRSDVAPLNHMIAGLLESVQEVHVLRDPTRGGLATTLVEIAKQSQVSIKLNEEDILIDKDVRSACDMLGLDPLYMANEGKVVVILPEEFAEKALESLQKHPYGKQARMIGKVQSSSEGNLLLKTLLGTTRHLDRLAGEMLPRIC
ncbi:MAG: hydrogenase expression/formation protein HypE [Anaerolineaceae bacterium]|nr:hydrogenase expression/formation protein HypE [Anaerolineaceae bacterium]